MKSTIPNEDLQASVIIEALKSQGVFIDPWPDGALLALLEREDVKAALAKQAELYQLNTLVN